MCCLKGIRNLMSLLVPPIDDMEEGARVGSPKPRLPVFGGAQLRETLVARDSVRLGDVACRLR